MTWKQAERYCKQHKEHGLTKWHLPSGRDLLELQKTKTSRKNDDVYWSNFGAEEDPWDYDSTHCALMEYKTIDGKNYWSVYTDNLVQ